MLMRFFCGPATHQKTALSSPGLVSPSLMELPLSKGAQGICLLDFFFQQKYCVKFFGKKKKLNCIEKYNVINSNYVNTLNPNPQLLCTVYLLLWKDSLFGCPEHVLKNKDNSFLYVLG